MSATWATRILGTGIWLLGQTVSVAGAPVRQETGSKTLTPEKGYGLVDDLYSKDAKTRRKAREALIDSGDLSMAAALVDAVFFSSAGRVDAVAVLEAFFDEELGRDFKAWVALIGRREDIIPKKGYLAYKAKLHGWIDPELARFLDGKYPSTIRPEEIVWGGVKKDGIPALTNPRFIDAEAAGFLDDGEPVFGVAINGDVRAYPHRIMDWHEMANDVVGGVPVTLSYCTLCGSGILFDTRIGDGEHRMFGSSGFLYRSNKLMYDQKTHTLWNNLTGEPVMGKLVGQGISLPVLPLTVTTWGEWRARHPETKTLSRDTGFERDYRPGAAYGEYFASPETMFPVWRQPEEKFGLEKKDWVWVTVVDGKRKGYPLKELEKRPVLLDAVDGVEIVLLTDPESGAVRVYRTRGEVVAGSSGGLETKDGKPLRIAEDALLGPDGEPRLPRLPGHRTFWFSWSAFFPDAPVYGEDR